MDNFAHAPRTRPNDPASHAQWSAVALALLAIVGTLANAALVWLRFRILWTPPDELTEPADRLVPAALARAVQDESLFLLAHRFLLALVLASCVAAVWMAVRAWRLQAQARAASEMEAHDVEAPSPPLF